MLEFVKKYKLYFIIVGAFLSLAVAGVLLFFFWYYFFPVAKVGDKSITRSEYLKEKENHYKMAEFMDDSNYSKASTIRDYLVERSIMDIIGAEKNITVSEEEIKSELESISQGFSSDVESVFAVYGDAYGLDSDELRSSIKYKLLKEKITNQLVRQKYGKLLYARFNEGNNVENILNISVKDLETNARRLVSDWKKDLDSGKKFDVLYEEVRKEGKYPAYYGDEFIFDSNRKRVEGEDDAILGTSKGLYSDIIKTPTYYAVYFVEGDTGGEFDSWEDLIGSYSERYVSYSFLSSKQVVTVNRFVERAITIINKTLGSNIALANCNSCSGCVGAKITGTVEDSLGNKLSSATIKGVSNSGDFCDGSTSSTKTAWCGYRSDSDSTGSNGVYAIGDKNGTNCNFNCAGGAVDITASKSRYNSVTESDVTVTNGSTKTVNFELKPVKYTLTVKVGGSGSGTVKSPSGGINCSKGGSVADCTASITYNVSNTSPTILTAYPASDSVVGEWTGAGCSGSGTTCDPKVTSDVTVVLTFGVKGCMPTCTSSTNPNICPADSTSKSDGCGGTCTITGTKDCGGGEQSCGAGVSSTQSCSYGSFGGGVTTTTYPNKVCADGGTTCCPDVVTNNCTICSLTISPTNSTVDVSDNDQTVSFSYTSNHGAPTLSAPNASVSGFNATIHYPGYYTAYLTSREPNCPGASATIAASVRACSISGIDVAAQDPDSGSTINLNGKTKTAGVINFKANTSGTLVPRFGFTSKWNFSYDSSTNTRLINSLPIDTAITKTFHYVYGLINRAHAVTFTGYNAQTATGAVIDSLSGKCSSNSSFSTKYKPYCSILSGSGQSPLPIRLEAKDLTPEALTGSSYKFTITNNSTGGTEVVNIAAPAATPGVEPAAALLTKVLNQTGAYKVSVQRGTSPSIECTRSQDNTINVTAPGGTGGGETTPN